MYGGLTSIQASSIQVPSDSTAARDSDDSTELTKDEVIETAEDEEENLHVSHQKSMIFSAIDH